MFVRRRRVRMGGEIARIMVTVLDLGCDRRRAHILQVEVESSQVISITASSSVLIHACCASFQLDAQPCGVYESERFVGANR